MMLKPMSVRAVKLLVPWQELGITETYEALTPQDTIHISLRQNSRRILITDVSFLEFKRNRPDETIYCGSLKHIKVMSLFPAIITSIV